MSRDYKETVEKSKMILKEASLLAEQITMYLRERPQTHDNAMTIVGFAIEILLGLPVDYGNEFDEISEDFREYLRYAHDDVKRILGNDINVN